MTTRLSGIALAGLIAALGATACGSNDDGDSGKKASPTKTKPDKEGTVPCGGETCTPDEGFAGQLCCRDAFQSKCGQMVAGSCTDLPPKADKRCPSTMFMTGMTPVMVPSCCNEASNQCGLVFNAGIGSPMCTTLTQAAMIGQRFMTMSAMGAMMFNFNGAIPEPVTCDGEEIESTMGAAGSGM